MKYSDLTIHPAAEIFPLMDGDDFDELVEDVRRNGLHTRIVFAKDGSLLDGRNRVRAAEEVGIEPEWENFAGDDEVGYVISLNIVRRHLNESQRAMMASKLATLPVGRPINAAHGPHYTQAEAADLFNVGERSLRRAAVVRDHGVPELVEAVERGDIPVRRAEEIAREDPETQKLTTAQLLVASNENEWYTPSQYIEAAREVLGGIDLDPASCAKANETVQADTFFTQEDDGLAQEWKGTVWINPPYGRLAGGFITRLVEEYNAEHVSEAIVLVNAHCTDTNWFQPLFDHVLCFTNHRIDFESADRSKTSSSTHGSVFIYLGDHPEKFEQEFAQFGAVVRRFYD